MDLEKDRRLELEHQVLNGQLLDEQDTVKVLQYLADLWGYPVVLYEKIDGETKKTHNVSPREEMLKLWYGS